MMGLEFLLVKGVDSRSLSRAPPLSVHHGGYKPPGKERDWTCDDDRLKFLTFVKHRYCQCQWSEYEG